MVAKTVALPNLRNNFIPDPGHIIAEVDLSGADAQVVAWEADDEDLKTAFRSGIKIHLHNAKTLFKDKVKGLTDDEIKAQSYQGGIYHMAKQGVHSTNYGATSYGVSAVLGISPSEAANFQNTWFYLHPKIKEWHKRTNHALNTTRTVYNPFGYRRIYFDRPDRLLPQALAWTPQSTVAIVTNRGMRQLRERVSWTDVIKINMQVHDSFIFQYPYQYHTTKHLREIREALRVKVPYKDPLYIPWGIKVSHKSWGECKDIPWEV